jgi:hypothetical protein
MKRRQNDVEKIATGIDDDEELERNATENEINEGEFTQVTRLVNDPIDNRE